MAQVVQFGAPVLTHRRNKSVQKLGAALYLSVFVCISLYLYFYRPTIPWHIFLVR